jgi:formylmethanofuran dehydrogenase subunit E
MDYKNIVEFHGHECPGLVMGFRMATAAMNTLNSIRSEDEEIFAIVENNACGVDALQCVTGCTFGKGNLIFHDYGKHVYTLYSRKTGKGLRVSYHGKGVPEEAGREQMIDYLLNADESEIITIKDVTIEEPEQARIHKSVKCDICGENVMETRIRDIKGKKVCIPCSGKPIFDKDMQ